MRLFLTLVLVFGAASAQAFDVPAFRKNVVDTSATLTPTEIGQLNVEIESIRGQSHIFAAVLIVPTLDGEAVESVAEKVFREWQLGQKGTDNGLLFLVVVSDRKMKIETGYGLEGSIPDAKARRLIDEILKPKFREKKFAEGLSEALRAANTLVLGGEPIRLKEHADSSVARNLAIGIWVLLILGLPTAFRAIAVHRARKYPVKLQPTAKESAWLRLVFGRIFFLPIFLLLNPGIFFVLFAVDGGQWPFCILFVGFAYIFIVAMNFEYINMWTIELRQKSFKKLKRRAKGSMSPFDAPADWSSNSSSSFSSSSDSSSDFSSSSDGGGSGGGGASGDW